MRNFDQMKKMNMLYIILCIMYIILTAHGGQKIDQPIQQHLFIARYVYDVCIQNICV